MTTIQLSDGHLVHGHAEQPADLSEPRKAVRLCVNKGPKRCVGSPSMQLRNRLTSRTSASWPYRVATLGKHVRGLGEEMFRFILKVDTHYLTHSWAWIAINSTGVHLPFGYIFRTPGCPTHPPYRENSEGVSG